MARSIKYGKLDIPGIEEDEPVFILRARDRLAIPLIVQYWYKCRWQLGPAWDHLDGIEAVRADFALWAAGHGTKWPDSPPPEPVVQLVQEDEPGEPVAEAAPDPEEQEGQLAEAAEG